MSAALSTSIGEVAATFVDWSPFEQTVAVAIAFLVGFVLITRLRPEVEARYDSDIAEMVTVTLLVAELAAAVLALAAVWNLVVVFDVLAQAVLVDRWTAVRQVVTVAVLATAYLVVRLVNRSIDRLAATDALTKHQSEVAYHVTNVGIFGFGVTVLLYLWGIQLGDLFIGAGVASAVIGLAARETLAAIIAGFVLLLSRPFRAGDWVEVDGRSGIVEDVTIINTKLRTYSDEHLLVPNDHITNNQLMNYSRSDRLRIELEVGVDYETDLEHAQEVAEAAIRDVDTVRDVPSPRAIPQEFGESSILLELRFWIGEPTMRRFWKAKGAVIREVKAAYEREDISIPFPQQTHSRRNPSDSVATQIPARDN
ncbi:mechanosensitive ion channel family protein [Haloprofundus salinisoli]|uniref:mechanosensitive ion channel family protein n=1 Tax=Haloprofundus salinisoli TaxID=2876193 RepID=UPI001CCA0ACD|nr:mechanosensitive ion channel family protein [Haloprofundus salinisoli]